MALVLNDRVRETSTTSGTGTLNLAGAVTGFETFVAGVGNSNTTYYAIHEEGTANWEVGLGTITDASPDTLSSRTPISSSNSDSAVDFNSGGSSNTLTSQAVASGTAVASVDFADSEWTSATFTAAYGVIYNSTTVDSTADRLVVVLDFGGDKTCTNGTFKITFPNPSTPGDAILSMA